MNRRTFRVLTMALCLVLAAAGPAAARDEDKRGHCSSGHGDWRLRANAEGEGKLRVRFEIEHVPAGGSWQVFLSDNGRGIFSGTRHADSDGEVHIRVYPANRRGTDHIAASGVNAASGVSCEGSLAFRG